MKICVYCSSSNDIPPRYFELARELGRAIVRRGHSLVYGGAKVGMMGVIADTVLAEGAQVIGVIPEMLKTLEIAHTGLTELHVVDSMSERRAKMVELSDAFIAAPGGVGTLEEITEVLSHLIIGLHRKPCAALNFDGYFSPIAQYLNRAEAEGFMSREERSGLIIESEIESLLDRLAVAAPPEGRKLRLLRQKPR